MEYKGTPYIYFRPETLAKIYALARVESSREIQGMGYTTTRKSGLMVEEIFPVYQTVTGGSCDSSEVDMEKTLIEVFAKHPGKQFNFWWHSHAQMSAYFSGTDDENITDLLDFDDQMTHLISLVVNVKGEHRLRLDFNNPRITIDKLPYYWNFGELDLGKWAKKEHTKHVTLQSNTIVAKKSGIGGVGSYPPYNYGGIHDPVDVGIRTRICHQTHILDKGTWRHEQDDTYCTSFNDDAKREKVFLNTKELDAIATYLKDRIDVVKVFEKAFITYTYPNEKDLEKALGAARGLKKPERKFLHQLFDHIGLLDFCTILRRALAESGSIIEKTPRQAIASVGGERVN